MGEIDVSHLSLSLQNFEEIYFICIDNRKINPKKNV